MKNIIFITLTLLLCYESIQFASASKPKEHINYTQFSKFKRVNKPAKVFPDNFTCKGLNIENENHIFTIKGSCVSGKRYFDIIKQIETRKGKNKINKSLLVIHKNLSTKKRPRKIKPETNKFEDKNGDGINDIVANPKL